MTIQVTGVLNDSSGAVSPNTPLQFVTVQGYAGTLRTATFGVLTGNDGSYDFTLATGKHVIYVKYGDRYEEIGSTIINSETPSPLSISELLKQTEPLAPSEITIVRELVSQAQDSANRAETAATATESDRAEVASNTATVQTNTNTVVAKAAEVESDRAEVATNKATVSADKAIVAGYKNQALTAKTEAQRWATGISGSGVNTPSDSNNAFYYSEVARNNANQTFKSGGYFTPTAGQEYPNVASVEVDTIWLIKFASETGSYAFTTGDLAGQTVKNGFMLVYDTPADTFDFIPTTLSGVASVNGVVPDAVGNIAINASDVGAVPTGRTVNSKALSTNITLNYSDVGAVPTGRTVNGKALTGNISLSYSDVGAPSTSDSRLSNSREWTASTVSQAEAEAGTATTRRAWTAQRVRQAIAAVTNGITLSALGGVPTSRTVNNKALTTNVSLTSSDVGALPITGGTVTGNTNFTGTLSEKGQRVYSPNNKPTATNVTVSATPTNYTASAQNVEAHLAGINTALGDVSVTKAKPFVVFGNTYSGVASGVNFTLPLEEKVNNAPNGEITFNSSTNLAELNKVGWYQITLQQLAKQISGSSYLNVISQDLGGVNFHDYLTVSTDPKTITISDRVYVAEGEQGKATSISITQNTGNVEWWVDKHSLYTVEYLGE